MALCCSKKLSTLFSKTISKHDEDFYFLNCLHLFRTENILKYLKTFDSHYRVIEMPKKDKKQ